MAVVLLLVWAGLVGWSLWSAAGLARSAESDLRDLRRETEAEDLLEPQVTESLDQVSADLADANARLRDPWVAPARILPVIGRQIRSLDGLTNAASEATDAGAFVLTRAQELSDEADWSDPASRNAALRQLGEELDAQHARLVALDLGPDEALVSPIRQARDEFVDVFEDVLDRLADGAVVARAVPDFLEGPRRYLVLAANNAEMRNGGGMVLSAGVLETSGGGFRFVEDPCEGCGEGPMVPVQELPLPSEPVYIDPDIAARWGWMNIEDEWRSLPASPRFPETARTAADMWAKAGLEPVDGVIVVDPVALEGLVALGGGVTTDEGLALDESDVLDYLLREQYRGFGEDFKNADRRNVLSDIAVSSLGVLNSTRWDLADMASEFADAAMGRHILVWSAREDDGPLWREAGLNGDLSEESLLLSLHNQSGTKLDQFVDVDATLEIDDGASNGMVPARLTVRLRNNAPETGLPAYVVGPHPSGVAEEGEYVGPLAVSFPADARDVSSSDDAVLVASGRDGPSWVHAVWVEVPRGSEEVVEFTFELPRSGRMVVEPSARVPPLQWQYRDEQWRDLRPREITW